MGCGSWFKAIISPKKAKVKSATKKSNGSNGGGVNGEVSNNVANGSSSRDGGVFKMRREDVAATRIQTAFRAFMARRALRHLRGTVRFNSLIEVNNAAMQTSNTLSHIHSWSRIQADIRARRLCMVAESRIRKKKLENQLKLEAKLHELQVEWCGGYETMEEILSRIQQREEAAIKRERAMAYAFSHQWRANSSPYFGQAYYDLGKESWGWSWMERWIAIRPWEARVLAPTVLPKKVQTKQGSKVGKTTNRSPTKILVSVKPISSKWEGNCESKRIKQNNVAAETQAPQEANTEVLSLSQAESNKTSAEQDQIIA
ncbi:protein IQ-DOMAIN 10-like [Cornus florida]|uniref:protein IQ-DOMAIN 10-like n=1 Tax=Cornus florida TaxID=4283 RepID=UPI0028A2C6DB|nr:protein IQ-DOMAIN 10-like [Cornus florida]XP_059661456.1 protein IQ-DOMAIN 10-like [Cornus florida]XP_059661457.1 protein IQ-DOMAIN 10-like [Cornus florida]XP_059661458.1 protein IQ-DOMAIN 10-like [Cornus florida]